MCKTKGTRDFHAVLGVVRFEGAFEDVHKVRARNLARRGGKVQAREKEGYGGHRRECADKRDHGEESGLVVRGLRGLNPSANLCNRGLQGVVLTE